MDEISSADKIAPRQKIDIMVPAHGKLEHTKACIEAIANNTFNKFHLIICDDSEASKSLNKDNPVDELDTSTEYFERLVRRHDNITYIKKDTPYISGNQFFNEAIAHMETPYLALIMNSVRPHPEWDRIGLKLISENPEIGVVGFKCIFPDINRIECAGIQIVNGYMPCDIGRDEPIDSRTNIYEVDAIQWAFALVRKQAVEGNLDETLFHGHKGWDDIDNCFVLRSKGWKIFYCGYGVGTHHPRSTRGTNSAEGYRKNHENAKIFWKRWGFWNNYLESKTLDVADKISDKMKGNLKAVFIEYQMCQSIAQQAQQMLQARQAILQGLVAKTLTEEVKVDPSQYDLGIDPARDIWDLKRKTEVEPAIPGNGHKPDEIIAQALADKAEAEKKVAEKL